jgi:hypothetical protein
MEVISLITLGRSLLDMLERDEAPFSYMLESTSHLVTEAAATAYLPLYSERKALEIDFISGSIVPERNSRRTLWFLSFLLFVSRNHRPLGKYYDKNWALVATPSYSGGRDQEDYGLKPVWGKRIETLSSKNTQQKSCWWNGTVPA